MSLKRAISSNRTSLRIAEESSIGVLPGTPNWVLREPNTYEDFGGEITTAPRKPIKSDRMPRKGPVVDVEAKGGFNTDLTQTNCFDLLQGFFFADPRRKAEITSDISGVTASTDTYTVASGGGSFLANDLLFAANFTNSANNGLHVVASSTSTTVVVGDGLVDETPPSTASIVCVGHQFSSGDLEVSASGGAFPTLTTSTKDLTQLGIVPGEWIRIGGDTSGTQFATAANNCWARVRSVATNVITLDKTSATMVTDTGASKTVQVFLGRVLKNETGSSITRSTFQLERSLGAPEDTLPGSEQAEYIVGGVCSEFALNLPEADKVTCDFSFMGLDHETRNYSTGLKSGDRPALVAEDAFNSSSSVKRLKFAAVSSTDSNPTELFSYLSELTFSINNGITRNIAIATVGAFEATEADFMTQVQLNAFFVDVDALASVRANTDLTIDLVMAQNNAGIVLDVPLLAGSGALANVEADTPIKLDLTSDGANGIDVDANLNHVALMVFFDYLPTAAM